MPTKLHVSHETPKASFDKRFFAKHYSYRDFYTATTAAFANLESYTFGTAARAVSVDNWPRATNYTTTPPVAGDGRLADEPDAHNTYARNVMVQCTEDAWIIFSCINPRWIRLYIKYLIEGLTPNDAITRLSAESISLTITEVPAFVPADALLTFYPTMAVAITFYYSTVAGTIRIWAEGNQEGLE